MIEEHLFGMPEKGRKQRSICQETDLHTRSLCRIDDFHRWIEAPRLYQVEMNVFESDTMYLEK